MSSFKLFGVAVLRAWEYGVAHGLGFIILFLLFIIIFYRRYNRLLQKDRAAKALHRTNVFVVVDGNDKNKLNNNDRKEEKNTSSSNIESSSLMKTLEEESDDDVDDIDYAKLLRELDTPANLRKQLEKDAKEQCQDDHVVNGDDDVQRASSSAAAASHQQHRRPLPPASTTRARPFALRLMDAIEHTAVTQLAELVRLHSSLHRQDNLNSQKYMDQIAVFDIPENVARTRAVSFLEGALRQRRREATISLLQPQQQQQQQLMTKDLEDELYHSLFDNHCTSSVPSPASILSSNRHNPFLVGTAKSNAPFMRQREAYYTTCIDAALSVEDATFNFATHFAYGTDVGGIVKPTTGRIMADFFLGADRFAKSNLRGGHVITAGGLLATMPDPLVCRRDLLLNERQNQKNASAASEGSSSSSGSGSSTNYSSRDERAAAQSAFRELSDDWTKGATWSLSSGNELDLLRRYDELVVLCVRSSSSSSSSSHSSSSDWSLPSCVPLFSSVHTLKNKQPRVITCTTPHALKYLLPEYSSPRDSTVSSQRRYRYHLENVSAIRKALEKHAEDIAIEGFAVGERVLFKRSMINKFKEGVADTLFGISKFLKLVDATKSSHQKNGGLFSLSSSSYSASSNRRRSGSDEEEMTRLMENDSKKDD